MHYIEVFNLMRTEVILPSSISKNRVFIPYINKIKRIFNFCGFSYRSNKWYIDKINNIFNSVNPKSIIIWIISFVSLVIYIKFFFNEYSFSFFLLWKSVEIFEDFFTSILIYIYCFFISLKVYTWKLLFNKNIIKTNGIFDSSYGIKDYNDSEFGNNFKTKIDSNKLPLLKSLYKSGAFYLENNYRNKKFRSLDDYLQTKPVTNKTTGGFKYTRDFVELRGLKFNKKKNNSLTLNNKDFFSFYYLNLNLQNFKNLKLNQWFSKYNGLNSTNYNYFYGINSKFNLISDNFKLFNINNQENTVKPHNNLNLNLFLKNKESSFFKYYLNYNNFIGNSNSWIFNKINLLQLILNNNNVKHIYNCSTDFERLYLKLIKNNTSFFLNTNRDDSFNFYNNFNFYNIKLGSINNNTKTTTTNVDMVYIKKIFFFRK